MAETAASVLRRARDLSGLSQREVAQRAGVSQPVISAYERGRREPSLSMLTKLVGATGCVMSIAVEQPDDRIERALLGSPLGQRVWERRDAIVAMAAKRGAHHVRLFGSVARGDESETSDVDLLVDLDDGVTLLDLIGLERELSQILGCDVDVVPARNLKSGVMQRVLDEAIPL